MYLRNLKINNYNEKEHALILEGIIELEQLIENNFSLISGKNSIKRDLTVYEFNFATKINAEGDFLIVYNTPIPFYRNNPYVFIYNSNTHRVLTDIDINRLNKLGPLATRQRINKEVAQGFKLIPGINFLGEKDIHLIRDELRQTELVMAIRNTNQ